MTYCVHVQGHGQKSEQKHRTKNFAKLPNHLPLLTMVVDDPVFAYIVHIILAPSLPFEARLVDKAKSRYLGMGHYCHKLTVNYLVFKSHYRSCEQ